MSLRRARRVLLLSTVALSMVASAVLPARSQVPGVPALSDILEQVGAIEGLAPLSPILNPVSDLVIGLENQLDDVLAEVPLVNALAMQGEDAVDAGIAFSQAAFPQGASTAILSREDLFADGFSSGGFQGAFDAPLLFTSSDDLDRRTGMELMRLGMDAVTILGGEDALHPLVVSKLEAAGLDVTRVGGPTRVETAVEAAAVTAPNATTAVLTRAYPDAGQPDSQAYADLLAAGPYAAENGWPILMTPTGDLHPAVAAHLADGFTEVVIIGGTGAVSQGVADELAGMGLSVSRIAGDNRFATAVEIAEARGFASSGDADAIVLAEQGSRDDVWAPGFASSAFASGAGTTAPVLLTDGPAIPAETLEFVLAGLADNLTDGGPAVVCATFVDDIACQAVALLMIGDLTDALGLLDGILGDLPLIGDLLAALGLEGLLPGLLQDLIDGLLAGGLDPALLTDLLGGLAAGDLESVLAGLGGAQDLLDGLLGGDLLGDQIDGWPLLGDILGVIGDEGALPGDLQGLVDGLLEGGVSPDQVTDLLGMLGAGADEPLTGLLEEIAGDLGGTVDDLVGGLLGGDAGVIGDVLDPVTGIIDGGGLLDGLDGSLDGVLDGGLLGGGGGGTDGGGTDGGGTDGGGTCILIICL